MPVVVVAVDKEELAAVVALGITAVAAAVEQEQLAMGEQILEARVALARTLEQQAASSSAEQVEITVDMVATAMRVALIEALLVAVAASVAAVVVAAPIAEAVEVLVAPA